MSSHPTTKDSVSSDTWSELSNEVRDHWSDVSDDDIRNAKGDAEELVDVIHRKTGEAREQIEAFVHEASTRLGDRVQHLRESAAEYSSAAAEAVRDRYERASSRVKDGYAGAQDMVRRRPTQSIGVAFGAGIVAGIALSVIVSLRRR